MSYILILVKNLLLYRSFQMRL